MGGGVGGGGLIGCNGYCITFKINFETKKKRFQSRHRRLGFPIFNRLREQKNKNPLFMKEEEAFSNCPVRP